MSEATAHEVLNNNTEEAARDNFADSLAILNWLLAADHPVHFDDPSYFPDYIPGPTVQRLTTLYQGLMEPDETAPDLLRRVHGNIQKLQYEEDRHATRIFVAGFSLSGAALIDPNWREDWKIAKRELRKVIGRPARASLRLLQGGAETDESSESEIEMPPTTVSLATMADFAIEAATDDPSDHVDIENIDDFAMEELATSEPQAIEPIEDEVDISTDELDAATLLQLAQDLELSDETSYGESEEDVLPTSTPHYESTNAEHVAIPILGAHELVAQGRGDRDRNAAMDFIDLGARFNKTPEQVRHYVGKLIHSGALMGTERPITRRREGGEMADGYYGRALDVIVGSLEALRA